MIAKTVKDYFQEATDHFKKGNYQEVEIICTLVLKQILLKFLI